MWRVERWTDRAVYDGALVPWYWQHCKSFDLLDTALMHARHKRWWYFTYTTSRPTYRVYNPQTKDVIMADVL